MKVNFLNSLIYNPIWISKLLHYFLSGATKSNNNKIKIDLIYLMLPFIYDEKILGKLISSTKKSSFRTLFQNAELKNRLIGIDQKITSFTTITNKAFVMAGGKIIISNDGYISTNEIIEYNKVRNELRDYYKASYNLGIILSNHDYREIFLKIGAYA